MLPPPACAIRGATAFCQDRAEAWLTREAAVIVVCDGAGGVPGSETTAEAVIAYFRQHPPAREAVQHYGYGARELLYLDERAADEGQGGLTTAVVCAIGHGVIAGASVGDSEAWLIDANGHTVLTAAQARSPLIGSGAAVPRAFRAEATGGRLLVATDGLFRYASQQSICAAARMDDPAEAVKMLIALVELPAGGLQDDIAIVLCSLEG
jgi:serine/threonine protein phosphatase PrpC